jgi:hypothetical protein
MYLSSDFMLQKTIVFIALSLILSACSFGKPSINGQLIKVEGETAFLQTPKNTTIKLPVKVKDAADLEKSKKNQGKCYMYFPDGGADPNQRYADVNCNDIGMTAFGENDGYVDVLDRVEKSGDTTIIHFAGNLGGFTVNSPTYEELRIKTGSCFRYSDDRANGGSRTLTELEDLKCQNLQSRRDGGSDGGDVFFFDSGGGSNGSRSSSGASTSRSSSMGRSGGNSSRVSSGNSSRSSSSFSSGRSGFGSSSSGSSSS